MDAAPNSVWRLVGATARGANHQRSGLPNQDAIAWRSGAYPGQSVVLAVADGHGAPLYVRSQRGARIATHVAVSILSDFAAAHSGQPLLSAVKRTAADRLPRDLVRAWNEAVAADLGQEPLGAMDLDAVAQRVAPSAFDRLLANPHIVYGATLLAVLITSEYMLAVQLGDGDIVAVADDGTATDWAWLRDPRLVANETTSLCSPKAWRYMHAYFQPVMASSVRLVLLSTDGYANSFEDRNGLLRAGQDMLTAIRADGLATISRQLPAWLHATSSAGSGDDITVGLAYRTHET